MKVGAQTLKVGLKIERSCSELIYRLEYDKELKHTNYNRIPQGYRSPKMRAKADVCGIYQLETSN